MPEGDTIERAARSLDAWLTGRAITAASGRDIATGSLVGRTVGSVRAVGKHLLVELGGTTLHTHMRMKGSWHVYRRGDRWRRPASAARVVLEAGDHLAVCFDAPVVELLSTRELAVHPALGGLGPDVLGDPLDRDEVGRRVAAVDPATPVGDVLLDQKVVAGIGNIWRAEALHRHRLDPHVPVGSLPVDVVVDAIATAGALMRTSVAGPRPAPRVYRRAGRACPRCGATVVSERFGRDNRTAYWCPGCQVGRGDGATPRLEP